MCFSLGCLTVFSYLTLAEPFKMFSVIPGMNLLIIDQAKQTREIRLVKIPYKSETEKKWTLLFCTRQDRDDTNLQS